MQSRTLLLIAIATLLCVASSNTMLADETESVFDRLDKDKDGFVTKDEVGEDQQRLLKRLLRTSDKNEDGKLSREEFVAGTKAPPAASSEDRPQTDRPPRVVPQNLFRRLDRNNDGKIEKSELPQRLQAAFDRIDGNSDGTVDQREFARVAARLGAPSGNAEQIARFTDRVFRQRDANNDGKISLNEVPQERREGFQRLLERFDDDGDKALTKEQFAKALSRGRAQPAAAPAIAERLKQADSNGDGKLSRAEAPERLRAQFDRLDANGDGQLDQAEIRRLLSGLQRRPQ